MRVASRSRVTYYTPWHRAIHRLDSSNLDCGLQATLHFVLHARSHPALPVSAASSFGVRLSNHELVLIKKKSCSLQYIWPRWFLELPFLFYFSPIQPPQPPSFFALSIIRFMALLFGFLQEAPLTYKCKIGQGDAVGWTRNIIASSTRLRSV